MLDVYHCILILLVVGFIINNGYYIGLLMTTFIQFLTEAFLLEAREDVIAQKQGPQILQAFNTDLGKVPQGDIDALSIVKHLSQAGPKYLQWITNQYIQRNFRYEDVPQLRLNLIKFEQLAKANQVPNKDIGSYKSLADLRRMLNDQSVAGEGYKGTLEKLYQGVNDAVKAGHGRWIYNNPDDPIKIYVPTDESGSVCIRRAYPDIGWCTTYDDDMEALTDDFIEKLVDDTLDDMEARAEDHGRNLNRNVEYDRIKRDIVDKADKGVYDEEIAENKENLHDYYIKQFGGEYYVILTPQGPFQFHFESNQFKDKDDHDIKFDQFVSKYPTIKKALGPIVSKLGHPHFNDNVLNMSDEENIKSILASFSNIDRLDLSGRKRPFWVKLIATLLNRDDGLVGHSFNYKLVKNLCTAISGYGYDVHDIANMFSKALKQYDGTISAAIIPGKVLLMIDRNIGREKLRGYDKEVDLQNIEW